MHVCGLANVLLVHCWIVSWITPQIDPVPWYVSPVASASAHALVYSFRALAARDPTFWSVRLPEPESPGFFTLRLNSVSHAVLALLFVLPPAVDRQALLLFTLLLSTSVPLANLLVGFVVSALK